LANSRINRASMLLFAPLPGVNGRGAPRRSLAIRQHRHRLLWTVSYQVCSPNPPHFCEGESDEILDRDLSCEERRLRAFAMCVTRAIFERFWWFSGAYSHWGFKNSHPQFIGTDCFILEADSTNHVCKVVLRGVDSTDSSIRICHNSKQTVEDTR
jgi:hypothetical protein